MVYRKNKKQFAIFKVTSGNNTGYYQIELTPPAYGVFVNADKAEFVRVSA